MKMRMSDDDADDDDYYDDAADDDDDGDNDDDDGDDDDDGGGDDDDDGDDDDAPSPSPLLVFPSPSHHPLLPIRYRFLRLQAQGMAKFGRKHHFTWAWAVCGYHSDRHCKVYHMHSQYRPGYHQTGAKQ